MNNTNKQTGTEVLLNEMVSRIIENPQRILSLDYDMMCDLVFMLFLRGQLDVAQICVKVLTAKHGKEKVAKDLQDSAVKSVNNLRWVNELETMYNKSVDNAKECQ